MFRVPLGCLPHASVQVYLRPEAKFVLSTPRIINATMRKKLYPTACERGAFTLQARDNREDVGSEIGKPEWNVAGRQLFVEGVSNGGGEPVNGDRAAPGDVIAAADSLWLLSTKEKRMSH